MDKYDSFGCFKFPIKKKWLQNIVVSVYDEQSATIESSEGLMNGLQHKTHELI